MTIQILAMAFPLVLISTGAIAKASPKVVCSIERSGAEMAMTSRQVGLGPADAMEALVKTKVTNEATIEAAYSWPVYPTKEMQDRAVEEFGADVEQRCLVREEKIQ